MVNTLQKAQNISAGDRIRLSLCKHSRLGLFKVVMLGKHGNISLHSVVWLQCMSLICSMNRAYVHVHVYLYVDLNVYICVYMHSYSHQCLD